MEIIMVVILVAIIALIAKFYFSLNSKWLRKGSKEYFINTNTQESANDSTIKESNNKFDGVNVNPEHKDNKSSTKNGKVDKNILDIAHESSVNQGDLNISKVKKPTKKSANSNTSKTKE